MNAVVTERPTYLRAKGVWGQVEVVATPRDSGHVVALYVNQKEVSTTYQAEFGLTHARQTFDAECELLQNQFEWTVTFDELRKLHEGVRLRDEDVSKILKDVNAITHASKELRIEIAKTELDKLSRIRMKNWRDGLAEHAQQRMF